MVRISAFLLLLSGCTSTPINGGCAPACATGFHCENQTCVADPGGPDAGGADATATCSPACGGVTPYCNASHHCVTCLTDDNCPAGHVCKKTSEALSSCVPGCMDAARCQAMGGAASLQCCDMLCTDTASDGRNCGMCGNVCTGIHAAASCASSMCKTGACDTGWGDCDGDAKNGCEANLHVDPANCSACGMACNAPNAVNGCSDECYIAACNFGYDDCNSDIMDGCETKVLSDTNNCGGCGVPCKGLPNAAATCTSGNCVLGNCNVGFFNCDGNPQNGCEVAIGTDANNCGKCGNVCGNGLVCVNGGCTCPKCNFPNAASSCVNNTCIMGACVQGFADCNNMPVDGCEVNLQTDRNNCNGCGVPCANGLYCVKGACQVGCLMGMGPPAQCAMDVDPIDKMSQWAVCTADCNSAWITSVKGGTYHAGLICKNLGYSSVGQYGGTCGDVCGYCGNDSCMKPGPQKWDMGGHNMDDMYGPILSFTVAWTCLK